MKKQSDSSSSVIHNPGNNKKYTMTQEPASTGELFSRTWEQYKQRALPILAVMLITMMLVIGAILVLGFAGVFGGTITALISGSQTGMLIVFLVMAVWMLLVFLLAFWSQTAMLAIVVNEDLGIIEALQAGWRYLWPMTWMLTIVSGIVISGLLLGFIPGIVFMVWFSFCLYTMIDENRRGLDGLLASREYVQGHWWNTFLKLTLIWLISFLVGIVPFIGQVLSFLFAPFLMLYMLEVYHDLKAVKGEKAVVTNGFGSRLFWSCLAALGLLIPIIGLIGALITFLPHGRLYMPELQRLMV